MPKTKKIVLWAGGVLAILIVLGMFTLKLSLTRPWYCATCHEDPYYKSWEHSDLLAAKHAEADVDCQACHPRGLGTSIREILLTMKGQTRIKPIRVPNQTCLNCHGSYEEIAERTSDLPRNPHKCPHAENLDCRVCHKMHKPSVDYCAKCHEPTATGKGWIRKKQINRNRGDNPPPLPPPESH